MPRRISVGNFPSSPPQHCASSFSQGSIHTITPSHPPSISDSMSSSLTCFPNSDGYGYGVSIQKYGSSLDVNFSQKSSSNFVHHELFIPSDVIHSDDNLQQTMELGFNSGSHELEEEPSIRELIRRLGDGYENVENAHYSSMHEDAFCVRERNTLGRIGTSAAAADTVKPEPLFPEISRNGSMATSLRLMHVADDSFAVEMAGPGKNSGKRKSFSPEKPKETSPADLNNCCEAVEEPLKGKRQKSSVPISKEREDMKPKRSGSENSANSSTKSAKENQKPPEPPKDYIHVRARRGQATDSHSLAERVRREKISERMKFLQDLVPGCSKVTGKAVMLDEIINYVQSLQRQVEFLSMKLSAVNPRLDINLESIMAKEVSHGSLPAMVMASQTGNYFQSQTLHLSDPMAYASLQDATQDHARLPIDVHAESMPQASSAWDGDLHSIVQMSFGQTLQSSADEGHHPCS